MIKLRRFEHEKEFQELVQLRAEIEAHDQVGSDTGEESLLAQFKWTNHQRWVLQDTADGKLIGHVWSFSQSEKRSIFQAFVHPDFRRQGWGTQLLKTAVNHAKEGNMTQIVSGARASNVVGHAFLSKAGFKPVGNNRFFIAPADLHIDQPMWPERFTVKSCQELGGLSIIVEGSNACYADLWGHRENTTPLTIDYVKQNIERWPDLYNPAGIFVVFDENKNLAGISFNQISGDNPTKNMDSPAIVPQLRHLDLLRPLVQHSLHWLNDQADGEIQLSSYGDSDDAVKVYEGLGFVLAPQNHLIEYLLN